MFPSQHPVRMALVFISAVVSHDVEHTALSSTFPDKLIVSSFLTQVKLQGKKAAFQSSLSISGLGFVEHIYPNVTIKFFLDFTDCLYFPNYPGADETILSTETFKIL